MEPPPQSPPPSSPGVPLAPSEPHNSTIQHDHISSSEREQISSNRVANLSDGTSSGNSFRSLTTENGCDRVLRLFLYKRQFGHYTTDTSNVRHFPELSDTSEGLDDIVKRLLLESHDNENVKNDFVNVIQSQWSSMTSDEDRSRLLDLLSFTGSGSDYQYDASELDEARSTYVKVDWEIPSVLEQIEQSGTTSSKGKSAYQTLSHSVILSGSNDRFECSTCKEFLIKRWGRSIGLTALEMVEIALSLLRMDVTYNVDIPLGPFRISRDYVIFHIRFDGLFMKSFLEALVWICSAIRVNPDSAHSSPGPPRKMYKSDTLLKTKIMGKFPFQFLYFSLLPLHELFNSLLLSGPSCWTDVFQSGIVAQHVPKPRWGLGLEISFEMMVHLAAVENYYPFNDGIILLGFSTALVPVSRDSQSGSIQWHFETTNETEQGQLSPHKLESVQQEWFQTRNIETLRNSKCFLGWFEHANILLGSSGLTEHTQMSWSGLPEQPRTIRQKGFEVGGQISIPAGPINIAPIFTSLWSFDINIQRFEPSQQYVQAVRLSSRKVAIVIDSATQQAWLVPFLNLVLHLCHRYLQGVKLENEIDPIPFANPSTNGSQAVIEAIEARGDLVVVGRNDTLDRETLRQLFLRINTNLLEAARTREKPNGNHVFASELMDMIFEPGGSSLKKINVTGGIESWKGLVEKADVVGCCTNIGQLIEPIIQSQGCECANLPQSEFLLAAHMRCLDELSTRAGSSVSKIQEGICTFGEKVFWCTDTALWAQCKEEAHTSIWTDTALSNQFIHQITRKQKHQGKGKDRAVTTQDQLALDGAVVFGNCVTTNWIKTLIPDRKRDTIVPGPQTNTVNGSVESQIDQQCIPRMHDETTSSS